MQTSAPARDHAIPKYLRSLDYRELDDESKAVVKAIQSNAYNDVLDDLRLIFVKLTLKSRYLEFFEAVSTGEQYAEIVQRVTKTIEFARKYGFEAPVKMGEKILTVFERVFPYLKEQSLRSALIKCWEDDPATASVAEIDEMLGKIKTASEAAGVMPEESVFEPVVKIVEYRQMLTDRFHADTERLLALRDKKKSGIEKQLLDTYLAPLEDKYPLSFDYVPDDDPFRQRANTLILHTPVPAEAALVITEYAKVNGVSFSVLDLRSISETFLTDLPELLRIAAERKKNLFVEGLSDFLARFEEKKAGEILLGFLRVGKAGGKVVLVDSEGGNDLYERIVLLTSGCEDLSILDISYYYLTMPKFDELIRLLIAKGLIDSVDDARADVVKNGMPFLGFVGLNEILHGAVMGKNFLDVGCAISERNNTPNLREYLSRIPNLALFIDSGWGNVFERKERELLGRPEFDYDAVRDVKRENIRKIVTYPCDYFAKAGLLVRYCTLGGDSVEKWKDLGDEERAKRIENAVNLLYVLFGIGFFPKIEITESMGSKFAAGLCVDGGKIIRFKKSSVQNYALIAEIILHESFHTFQHKAINSPYYKWYWTELGVKPERIRQWSLNNASYISPEKTEQINAVTDFNIDYYRLQVFETEAYAFEKDAVRAADGVWNLIDFE